MATKKKVPVYSGPSREFIQAMSDEEITKAFAKHKHKPRPLELYENDEVYFLARYSDKDCDFAWTPTEIEKLKQRVIAWHKQCLRSELFAVYIERWVETLNEDQHWSLVSELEGKPSVSEKRHMKSDTLRQRAFNAAIAIYSRATNQETNPQQNGGNMP